MEESLEAITKAVNWYSRTKSPDPNLLLESLRVITSHLFTLETHRAIYQNAFESIVFDGTKVDGESVARAKNRAEVEVPELYKLRRIMEASYRVADAIRTTLSFIKHEQSHLS
jgi:hypothetical protein